MDLSAFWNEAIAQIKAEIDEGVFEWWFSHLEFISSTPSEITLSVPSLFYRDKFTKEHLTILQDKMTELTGRAITFSFIVPEKDSTPKNDSKAKKAAAAQEQSEEGAAVPQKPAIKHPGTKKNHNQLNKDYNFDNFVIGENAMAYNASLAIGRDPGTNFNPFLIYGGVGLGKTHLMQAIGNAVYQNNPDKTVIYVPAENFVNEFITSLGNKDKEAFKKKYRQVDVLLLDDIHDLVGKKETQEELFNTFNALFEGKKQMVFTCDRPPTELKSFTERLLSRLTRGLVVDLQMPSWETRLVILKKKVESKKLHVPHEVLEMIAKNVNTNVRDLESALETIRAYAELVNKEITVEIAQRHLKNIFAGPAMQNIPIELVQRVVAEYYNMSVQDLKGKKRTQTITHPRQVAMYIIRELTEYSTTEVGLEFGGRDHTTVMHAVQRIEDKLKTEPSFEVTLHNLIRAIKERVNKPL